MKIKYFRGSFLLAAAVVLVLGIEAQPTAQPMDNPDQDQQQSRAPLDKEDKEKPRYAPDRFIVKFKSDGPEAVNEDVEYLLESNGRFQDAVSDKSDSLDKLREKHKVKKAKSVFIERYGLTTVDAKKKQHDIERLSKAKHPSRSRRAPKDAAIPDLSNVYVLEVPAESDIEAIIQEFQADPHVEYAQPDYIMEAYMVPNDPYYSSYGSWSQPYDDLWGLKKIQAEQAWDITQGEGIIVAVVDSGLDYNHPDIAGNVWINPCEDLNGNGIVDLSDFNGVDDACVGDQPNGYMDDVRGWDFTTCAAFDAWTKKCLSPKFPDNDPRDSYGHGTHVSGTIAAAGNNNQGIIGVAPRAKVMAVKGLNDAGQGSDSNLAAAIYYAVNNGADIINNSWGGSGDNPFIRDAVNYAHFSGAVIIAAAGNSNADTSNYTPTGLQNVISVAAFEQDDQKTYFSNFGSKIDVAAPGGGTINSPPAYYPEKNILSLLAQGTGNPNLVVGGEYLRQAGTSMAAPHVSGVAALVLSHNPDFTNEEVRQVLRVSSDDVDSPGFDINAGHGRINAFQALNVGSVLQARINIDSLGPYFLIQNEPLIIQGTATGPGFQQYQLFYSRGDDPQNWISINAPAFTPVSNDVLAAWDTSRLQSTMTYTIRLVVSSSDRRDFEDFTQRDASYPYTKITDFSGERHATGVDGDRIVYFDGRYGNFDIFLYDINTGVEQRITTDTSNQKDAVISGDWVVWVDYRHGGTSNPEIYLYDITTGQEQRLTNDTLYQYNPAISGSRIVWQDSYQGQGRVYLYDINTGIGQVIAPNGYSKGPPDISGDRIVYHVLNDSTVPVRLGISLYNIKTGQEQVLIDDPAHRPSNPRISGSYVVWEHRVNEENSDDYDIYMYDINKGTLQRLTTAVAEQHYPSISGYRIVWQDDRAGRYIYSYNIKTGKEERLKKVTNCYICLAKPEISDNRLVWSDMTGEDDWNIFLMELPTPPPSECGDGICQLDEGFTKCESDCPSPNCGDGFCSTLDGEDGNNCQPDCSFTCGDGVCQAHEGYTKCQRDCPSPRCGDGFCSVTDGENGGNCPPDCSVTCGDSVCTPDEGYIKCEWDCPSPNCGDRFCSTLDGEDGNNCQPDCSITCGDGICTPDEGYMKCQLDCPSPRCGDGFCSALDGEDGNNCQPDCSVCGDGICQTDEGYTKCRADCPSPTCGDGICQADDMEDERTCQPDCPVCGNHICEPNEGFTKCEWDCPSPNCGDGFCSARDGENGGNCQPDCTVTCGDNICTPDEGFTKCEWDCPSPNCGDGFCSVTDGESGASCQPDCTVTCGDNICTPDEGFTKCEWDCPSPNCGDGFCSVTDGESGASCQPDCTVTCGDNICTPDEGFTKCEWDCPSSSCGDGVCAIADGENQTTCGPDCRPPELAPIGNKTVNEGETLTFTVTATDPTGDVLTYTADGLPSGATFNGQIFAWTPDYTQAGTYDVLFTVSDGVLTDVETIAIIVLNVNRPPVLLSVGSKTVNEGQPLSSTVSATDPDGDSLTWKLGELPDVNADGFIDWVDVERIRSLYGSPVETPEQQRADLRKDGRIDIIDIIIATGCLPPYAYGFFELATGNVRWTPNYTQAGNYNVTFTVSDETLTASETITITVNNVNRPPVLNPIGSKSVKEGQLLNFSVSASDPDGDTLTYSASGLPAGATFSGQTFSWTPSFTQSGTYNVTFTASDSGLTASETVAITVLNTSVPDMIISSLSTATSGLAPGQSLSLSNTVKNKGTASSSSFAIAFSLSNDRNYGGTDDIALSATRTVNSLTAGSSNTSATTVTVPSFAPFGSYYICAKADSGNTVIEQDEANNTFCTTYTIQVALFDLFMNVVSGPSAVTTGKSFTVSYSVTNQSTASADRFYVGLYLSLDANITTSDTLMAGEWITSLAGGSTKTASRTLTLSTSISPGTYYLGAIADRDNRIKETNETNNAIVGNIITVTSGADIVMNSVGATPSSAVRGTTNVTFTCSLNNQGVSGTTTIYVGFYLSADATITTSDIYIDRVYFTNVSPGLTYTASISRILSTSIPAGTYYVGAIADYTNVTKESNETNNARAGNTIVVQ